MRNMSLTTSDLKSIKDIVDTSVSSSEARLIKRIDDLDDTLSMQVEHGLQEVRDQVGEVKQIVNRIEKVQLREMIRVDGHETSIVNIRKSLHAA